MPPLSGRKIINDIRTLAAAILAGASIAAHAQSPAASAPPDTHWKFGVQLGSVHDNGRSEPDIQLTFGYDFDRTWSIEALASINALFIRDGASNVGAYEFDNALGARVLARLPLGERWSLVGGLGVTQVHEERGLSVYGDARYRTGALVSLGAMYRISRRWSMGLETSTFTQSHTLNAGLRGELHF